MQNYENYHAISQFQSFLSIFINFYCSIFAKGAILIDLSRINYGFYLKCFAKVEFQFVYWQRRTCMRYEPKYVLLLQITTFNTGCKKKPRYNSVNVLFLYQHFNDMFTHFEVLFFLLTMRSNLAFANNAITSGIYSQRFIYGSKRYNTKTCSCLHLCWLRVEPRYLLITSAVGENNNTGPSWRFYAVKIHRVFEYTIDCPLVLNKLSQN